MMRIPLWQNSDRESVKSRKAIGALRKCMIGIVSVGLAAMTLAACSSSAISKKVSSSSKAVPASLHDLLPANIRKTGVITVGVNAITPPFDYYVNGKLSGIEAAMRGVMAKELGVTFKATVIVPFSALIPGLESGRYDMIMGEMTDTTAREKVVTFVDYLDVGYGLLVKGGNPDHITSMASLCGLSFGAVIGTIPAQFASAQSAKCVSDGKKPITIVAFPSNGPMVVGVESNRIQATVNDYPTMVYAAKESDGALEVVGKPFDSSPYGIAIMPSNKKLIRAIQRALQEGLSDGAMRRAVAAYGVDSLLPAVARINGAG